MIDIVCLIFVALISVVKKSNYSRKIEQSEQSCSLSVNCRWTETWQVWILNRSKQKAASHVNPLAPLSVKLFERLCGKCAV